MIVADLRQAQGGESRSHRKEYLPSAGFEIRIPKSQTGNPPEGWESAGQIPSTKPGPRPEGGDSEGEISGFQVSEKRKTKAET